MKFSATFIGFALATSLCTAQKPLRRNYKRKSKRRERKLSLSYLVNHFNHNSPVESENNDVTGRASMLFDNNNNNNNDQQIIGVHFLPIYADSDLKDGPATAKELPKEAPKELPKELPKESLKAFPKEVPKEIPKLGPGGFNRNGNGTMRKKYVVRHKVIGNGTNRSGSGVSGVSKSKEGSKSKQGGNRYRGSKNLYSECREQCQYVPLDADPFRTPVCDASSMSVLDWVQVAENNCCCSEGISFLKLTFDTMYYGENFQLAGSFSIASDTFDAQSIRVVDCFDSCLRNPMRDAVCSSARDFHDQVVTGTDICIVQVDERNIPRFDWNFPPTLEVQFESNVQERFVAAIDTTCGVPPVSPWATVAYPEGMMPRPFHINTEAPQAGGFNFPIFEFSGGMSTGAFLQALDNPFQEAGYQLGLEQCGCNCADFPPTEAPTWGVAGEFDYETDTLPPTIDWSCEPSPVPDGGTREAMPIDYSRTEERTEPPTVLFSVPSPVQASTASPIQTSTGPTNWPTREPTAPPTAIPTIQPTPEPTNQPTEQPTSEPTSTPTIKPTAEPTATPSEKPTMPRISAAATQGETMCSAEGAKSIYNYICQISNFSNFCRMVERAGLVELLDGTGDNNYLITMFVPTNRATKSSGLNSEHIDATDIELLKHIVLTHGTAGKIEAQNLQCSAELPTLEGTFSVHSTKCFATTHAKAQVGFFNTEENYPMVLSPNNIELCNGFVQPVNNMLRVINF